MTPSELQTLLHSLGIKARKRFSQNFLIDKNIVDKILTLAAIQPGDHCLEIGPGPGALTTALLARGARVTAIEIDTTFAAALERLQTQTQALEVITADFLKFPLESFLATHPDSTYKVVANLPYHITTPILVALLPQFPRITSLTVMVQKEFADRMAARVGTPDYSSFTLFLQFYATLTERFSVSPNSFYPRPTVHSSVVHCRLHKPPLEPAEPFFQLTRTAFQKRRKMLKSSLKLFGNIEDALQDIGKPPTARPEELSLSDWLALTKAVEHQSDQA